MYDPGPDTGGRKLHRALAVQYVVEGLVVGLRADRHDAALRSHLADPRHLGEIELDALLADQLRIGEPGREVADGEPVGLGVVDQVRADDMAGTGPVLDHESRAREHALHVMGNETSPVVVPATGRGRDDPLDRPAVEIRFALFGRRGIGRPDHQDNGSRERDAPTVDHRMVHPCLPDLFDGGAPKRLHIMLFKRGTHPCRVGQG